jgi:transposase
LCEIKTVAMQSTGVYWMTVYDVLTAAGFDVCLANARGTKNLPGRKSDVQECVWIRKLHMYGLLRKSFHPPEAIRRIRTLWRLRDRVLKDASRAVQHMQKAMTMMNVQLTTTISDVSGVTGMKIIRAIVQGERDRYKLAKLRDVHIQASEEEIAHSLEGNWREDVLFELKQVVKAYDFHQQQLAEIDAELEQYMRAQPSREPVGDPVDTSQLSPKLQKKLKPNRKSKDNRPAFDLGAELARLMGVDLRLIDGIDVMTIQTIYSEMGADLSAFPNEKAFSSWLELVCRNNITGGKIIKQEKRPSKNRVTTALRNAAESLVRSDSYLGARYRYYTGRQPGVSGVKTMAHYLACVVYRMMTKGPQYVDRGATYFENKRRERELESLYRRAASHGMKLVPAA